VSLGAGGAAIAYPRDPVRQYLRYGSMYDASLTVPAR
jgi:hypothetical protein